MFRRHIIISAILGIFAFFCACSNSYSVFPECPDGYECTDLKAYSFIYYSGKNTLDTITETTDNITCDIHRDYFQCTVKQTWSRCRLMYASTFNANNDNDKRTLTRVDTTFINYGYQRLTDYIPPYNEKPKVDVEKMRAAFDTVIVKKATYSDSVFSGYSADFLSWENLDDDGLPEWASLLYDSGNLYVFDGKDGTPNADTVFEEHGIILKNTLGCDGKSYQTYPQAPIVYNFHIWFYTNEDDEPIKHDTTITWIARYRDEKGDYDSASVTTFFKIN